MAFEPDKLVNVQLLTGSANNYTPTAGTRVAIVQLVGGGGGGGGTIGNNTDYSVGGGGGAGAFTLALIYPSPGIAYTASIGAAGNGVSDAAGNAGGTTYLQAPITLGGSNSNITAPGGSGGAVQNNSGTFTGTVAGGAGGTAGSNGKLAAPGSPGGYGWRANGTVGYSGAGGSQPQFGAGGVGQGSNANANGNNASGYGAGGGGSSGGYGGSTAYVGGYGTAGCILVEEYS